MTSARKQNGPLKAQNLVGLTVGPCPFMDREKVLDGSRVGSRP